MKNHGLNLELEKAHQKPQDWVFGATSPKCIAEIPFSEQRNYLPTGEIQRGVEDTFDCASRAPVNILETKFNYLINRGLPQTHLNFLTDNGYIDESGRCTFSDAFVAIKSGTTRNGNSLIAPLEAIRKNGLIPKSMLPLLPTMTFDEYHNPARITSEMEALGQRFLELFSVNYERVFAKDYSSVTTKDMVDTGGFAWGNPVNGVYQPEPYTPNHAFAIFGKPDYQAFDNYPDTFDGDFTKHLSPAYGFIDHGYRVILSLKAEVKKSLVERLVAFIKKLFNL